MFALSLLQEILHADSATSGAGAVMTDRLECEIESALTDGWRPHQRVHRQRRTRCRPLHRRARHDDGMFRP